MYDTSLKYRRDFHIYQVPSSFSLQNDILLCPHGLPLHTFVESKPTIQRVGVVDCIWRRLELVRGAEEVGAHVFKMPNNQNLDEAVELGLHKQWYFTETTRDLVHGFSQALMRRGLPRLLMSDNGSAMTSAEFIQGLSRLRINHATTMAYSPNQNGKIESSWHQVESTLMAMLERKKDITLNELNRITHAWIEMDYHHQVHSTTKQTPICSGSH